MDYTWRVNEDLCSSDHYPIFIESNNSIVEERVQHWRLHRADWEAFQQSCGESLTISQFESEEGVDDPIALFTAKLHNIADKSIPKTSTVPKRIDKPWLDENPKGNRQKEKILAKIKKNIQLDKTLMDIRKITLKLAAQSVKPSVNLGEHMSPH